MLILGFESSCDETGVALVQTVSVAASSTVPRLVAHALHSHIRRALPLADEVLASSGYTLSDVDAVAYTQGPGLAGALLVGAGVAVALGAALGRPVMGVQHLEGHLLSPFLSADPPEFPFISLLGSGGHTQLMRVEGVGR